MRCILAALALQLAVVSCTSEAGQAGAPGDPADAESGGSASAPAEWRLTQAPILSIGVREGGEPYELHNVRAAALLSDGRVVIGDQGSMQLRVYAPDGTFLRSQGREGDGPAEWRSLHDVRALGGDTVAVHDLRNERVGFVDVATGSYVGEAEGERAADLRERIWFRRGLLVDAHLESGERGVLASVLAALDARDPSAPTFVSVADDGKVWVRSAPSAETRTLRLFDLTGRERAVLPLPPSFRPLAVADRVVLGVWHDDLGVASVRLYALEGADAAWDGPTLADALADGAGPLPPAVEAPEGALADVTSFMRSLAGLQEMNYAREMSYTTDVQALVADPEVDVDVPAGVRIDVLNATPTGWRARLVRLADGSGCYLAYGRFAPVEGLLPGSMHCWGAGVDP